MGRRNGQVRFCAGLSSEARAWERRRLQELGLEDVVWDHDRWCPRCRAVLAVRSAAGVAEVEAWKMPADKHLGSPEDVAGAAQQAPAAAAEETTDNGGERSPEMQLRGRAPQAEQVGWAARRTRRVRRVRRVG
ncbi:hypothetical protein [Chondromyces apiculatus]|uniref:Uncharacterized protein n=1 Tax=Chondromyces apiculatus DSM 436 TaxID=1192034 RepID=A0A017TGV9_9BACT|nr:hypothetical protein [Chondromyces apiculatus]EYF08484.1 Hypothetical protein CAP_4013 [Chondromyces apiculatus DSM 436]